MKKKQKNSEKQLQTCWADDKGNLVNFLKNYFKQDLANYGSWDKLAHCLFFLKVLLKHSYRGPLIYILSMAAFCHSTVR